MKTAVTVLISSCIWMCTSADAQSAASAQTGNGPYVVPSSAAFSLLSGAAGKIMDDVKHASTLSSESRRGTSGIVKVDDSAGDSKKMLVVLYDAPTFNNLAYYHAGVAQVRLVVKELCSYKNPQGGVRGALSIDTSGAKDLASIAAMTFPSYASTGGSVSGIDTTSLVAALQANLPADMEFVNPAYLTPFVTSEKFNCRGSMSPSSFARLWNTGQNQADLITSELANLLKEEEIKKKGAGDDKDKLKTLAEEFDQEAKPMQAALNAFQKLSDWLLATDKGVSLLTKLLVVESLANKITSSQNAVVLDVKLDAVNMDAVTKTQMWWKRQKIFANVLAHYTIVNASTEESSGEIQLGFSRSGLVNILLRDLDPDKVFKGAGSSVHFEHLTTIEPAK